MTTAERISVQEARQHLQQDPDALLVCAYESDQKFQQNHLEGAIPLSDLESRLDSISKDQELIFHCH